MEPLEHRRAAASALGADVVVGADEASLVRALQDTTGGRGADVVIEVAGNDAAVALAVHAARPGGQVVLAGIPGEDSTTFPAAAARRKGLTLKLSRRMKEMYPRTTRLVDQGRVDVRSVVSHSFSLDQVDEAFRTANDRVGLKVLVTPSP